MFIVTPKRETSAPPRPGPDEQPWNQKAPSEYISDECQTQVSNRPHGHRYQHDRCNHGEQQPQSLHQLTFVCASFRRWLNSLSVNGATESLE